MKSYIIDTSVVVKWFNQDNEKFVKQAFLIGKLNRDKKIELFSSDLLIHELTNALLKGKHFLVDEAQESIRKLYRLPIAIIPTNSEISQMTVKIADKYSITTYDAIYVALAKQIKCQLITANPKCHGKIKDGSVIDIADFTL